jgi:hypothetical protein
MAKNRLISRGVQADAWLRDRRGLRYSTVTAKINHLVSDSKTRLERKVDG